MKNIDISQCIKIQKAEYEKIRKKMCKIQCVDALTKPAGGYIVAFRHPKTLMDKFTQFTDKIRDRDLVKSIIYDSTNAHTTIVVTRENLTDFKVDKNILLSLNNAYDKIETQSLQAVRICYKEWLFTKNTVIVAGRSINGAFWEVAKSLIEGEAGKKIGLKLEDMPKIAHITAARFLEKSDRVKDLSDRVKDLKALMSEGPILGESKPIAVWIGYYECSENGFHLTPYKERNL